MSNLYGTYCDDFYVNLRLCSQMRLPESRETLLHFFERVGRSFPGMNRFRAHDNGEYTLEEDRGEGSYRWASIEANRLAAGHVNPANLEEALKLHTLLLELAPYNLGLSRLEIDHMDVLFGFDLSFTGNHDEIIAESLYGDSPLTCLAEESGFRPIDFQPTVTVAMSDDCRLQGRIDIVTRTSSHQVRTGEYGDDVISVYLILRRYWGDQPNQPLEEMFRDMVGRADALCVKHILPRIIQPISSVIASRS